MELIVNTIKGERYYKQCLSIMACLFNLTKTEIDILAIMLDSSLEVVNKDTKDVLIIRLDKEYFTITNHIKRLKNKGILVKNEEGNLAIHSKILTVIEDGEITFKFNIKQSVN